MSDVLVVRVTLILSVICLRLITSTELIPERVEILNVNEKYLRNFSVFVRRTDRRSPYYLNFEGTSLAWLGDNVTVHGVFYEFLHNEYKRSFVELNMNVCDILEKEPWRSLIGTAFEARGMRCPLPAGTYKVHNMSVTMLNFPYVMPFEKAMLQGYAKLTTTQEILARVNFYIRFKPDNPKGK